MEKFQHQQGRTTKVLEQILNSTPSGKHCYMVLKWLAFLLLLLCDATGDAWQVGQNQMTVTYLASICDLFEAECGLL